MPALCARKIGLRVQYKNGVNTLARCNIFPAQFLMRNHSLPQCRLKFKKPDDDATTTCYPIAAVATGRGSCQLSVVSCQLSVTAYSLAPNVTVRWPNALFKTLEAR